MKMAKLMRFSKVSREAQHWTRYSFTEINAEGQFAMFR